MTAVAGSPLAILSMKVWAKLQAGQPYENTSVTSILALLPRCGGSMTKYCLPASQGDGTSAAWPAMASVSPNSTASARTSIALPHEEYRSLSDRRRGPPVPGPAYLAAVLL